MRGWTADGTEVELTGWQEKAVRALLDGRHKQVFFSRGRRWGWTTVLHTAIRYDRNPELLGFDEDFARVGADAIGPPPVT